jgi:hypothetical protein
MTASMVDPAMTSWKVMTVVMYFWEEPTTIPFTGTI